MVQLKFFLVFCCFNANIVSTNQLQLCNRKLSPNSESKLCQKSRNNELKKPPLILNGTLDISSLIEVIDIGPINEDTFLFRIYVKLHLHWIDKRIGLKSKEDGNTELNFKTFQEVEFWKPNLVIYNSKNIRNEKSLQNDQVLEHCKVTGNQTYAEITLTNWFEVDITCGFNHTYFPFDVQNCLFRYGIQEYSKNEIVFKPAEFFDWTTVTDSYLQVQNTRIEFAKSITSLGERSIGNWSITGLSFRFKRDSGKYIFGYYGPSFIIVMISWLNFLISHKQVSLFYICKFFGISSNRF